MSLKQPDPTGAVREWGAAEGGVVLSAVGATQALVALSLPWYRVSGSLEPVDPAEPLPEPVEHVWQGWSLGAEVTLGDVTVSGSPWLGVVAVVGGVVLAVLGFGVLVGRRGLWPALLAAVAAALLLASVGGVAGQPVAGWQQEPLHGVDLWRLALALTAVGGATRWWATPAPPAGVTRSVEA